MMYEPTSKGINVVIPKYGPGEPPKKYNAKRAVGIFACLCFSYGTRCPELLRARMNIKGDIYVIPHTEYMGKSNGIDRDIHMSHHKSGEFHWVVDRNHVQPAFGEADFPAAFGLWLKLQRPPCFCFRRGKGLDEKEIATLVECLAKYLPFKIDTRGTSQSLRDFNFYRAVAPDLKTCLRKAEFVYNLLHGHLITCLKSLKSWPSVQVR